DVEQVGHEADKERAFAGPRRGRVEIEDPLDSAHGALFRRNIERGVGCARDKANSYSSKKNATKHSAIPPIPPKDIRRKATTPSKTPRQIPRAARFPSIPRQDPSASGGRSLRYLQLES